MFDNVNILIKAIATLFWFKGMYRILDEIVPDKWINNIILVITALIIFYMDDTKLDELGSSNIAANVIESKKTEKMKNINRTQNF